VSSKAKTVVVMSDTHARTIDELPTELITAVREADYVIHLGDFTSLDLVNELKRNGNFSGILGNHDDIDLHRELKWRDEIEIGGKKLGLMHGLINPVASRMRMRRSFHNNGHRVNAILYGHTHLPTIKYEKGLLYFNPGSVAGKFPASVKSFGILTIDGTITGKICLLETHSNYGPAMYVFSLIMRGILRTAESIL
jgi:uncharacterized protein